MDEAAALRDCCRNICRVTVPGPPERLSGSSGNFKRS